MNNSSSTTASCSCNTTSININAAPLFRAYCHCKTCQTYTGQPFADVTIFKASDIQLVDDNSVDFKAYQKPPLVKRGRCISCSEPTIENASMPVLPDLKILSTAMLPEHLKTEPRFHIFYHRRLNDFDDDKPKYSTFISSQLAFMRQLFASLRKQ